MLAFLFLGSSLPQDYYEDEITHVESVVSP